jgi:Zn-dependent protease
VPPRSTRSRPLRRGRRRVGASRQGDEHILDPLQRIIVSAPVFLLAIVLHEVAHGYVAYRLGDDTAKLAGRLTLNPIAHLDVLGTLMFIVSSLVGFGFGWAKPVPVNPLRLRHFRRGQILVSLAGVTANLAQALAWAGLLRLAYHFAPDSSIGDAAIVFCSFGIIINLILLIFNLLPVPPLDGWRVLTNALRISYTAPILRLESMGFMLLFVLLYLHVLDPVFHVTLWPLYNLLVPRALGM